MQNKVIVFGKLSNKIENFLHERGIFDALSCFNFDDCLSLCKNVCGEAENVVVLCKNQFVDLLVEKLKTSDDKMSLISEQAVKIERQTTFKTTLIVPIEAEYVKILNDFLPAKQIFVRSIFGKSEDFLNNKLEELKQSDESFVFKIVSKSAFLHIVYSTKQIDESIFEGGSFSHTNESLSSALASVLKEKSLAVAEFMTFGALSGKLASACKENLKEIEVLACGKDFEKVGLDELFLEQNGTVSKETAFALAKNLLKNKKTDLAVAITGFDCDAGRTFVAVGNKHEIHVYSSVFYGERNEIVENSTDFAIFKAICFLKEKYQ